MMFLNNIKSPCGSIICLLLGLMPFASAAPQVAQPPGIPTFTEAKVEHMLDSLDEGRNFLSLKIRYFGGHTDSPFFALNGFELLQDKLQKQEMGSLKWFQLESLKGYAAFHVSGVSIIEGYDAYGLLFDEEVQADSLQTQKVVRASIHDFVNVACHVDATFGSKHLSSDSLLRHVLLKAWLAWNRLPPSTSKVPDWGRAVKAINAQNEFKTIIEKTLNDPTNTPGFSTLKLAVVVLQDKEKPRAIELLQTAQKKMQYGNRRQQKWLYETWMQLITGIDPQEQRSTKITDQKVLANLAKMRKDQISYTGTGYADLLQLYWQLGQYDKANDLMTVAKGPGIRGSQKIDVAKVLLRPPTELKFSEETVLQLQEQGVALLQAYLTATGERQPNDEIRARYELGRYFIKQDQITEALQALNVDALKPPARYTRAAMYYEQIEKMKADLAEKLKGVDGVR